jgi:hypothetical protein
MGEKIFPPSERCPCGRTGKPFAECCLAEGVNVEKLRQNVMTALRHAGAAPEIVYAYERTGILVVDGLREVWSAADLDEWDDAIAEYLETRRAPS